MIEKLEHALAAAHWSVWLGLLVLVAFAAHHVGYFYGRTYELYESAKRCGRIPETMTWAQFLKRKRP